MSLYLASSLLKTAARLAGPLRLAGMLLMLAGTLQVVKAQVITQRFAASSRTLLTGPVPTLTLPPVDLSPYLKDDSLRTKAQHPYRFGAPIAVDVDLLAVADQSTTLANRVYRYQLYSAGALSLNLIIDRLQLAPGAQLYLYDPAMSMQIGPITALQTSQTGEFWSDLIQGERLILELREPLHSAVASQVHLRTVIHGYRNVFSTGEKAFGQSGSCEVNMACFPAYQFDGDGVVIILTEGGTAYCSGSILNDSRQSFRSFLLSANHCNVTDNSLVRFKYQSPACASSTEPAQTITMNGSDFRANYGDSDFSLRELKQQIPANANVTYLGWNRTDANVSNAFGIHHPAGDLKKISFTNADTQISGFNSSVATTHLHAYWDDKGVTEGGSSGSPLLDGNRRVVGQLHGGPSYCAATGSNRSDYYGRIFTSWTGGGTNATRLSNWLDPDNRGNLLTDGAKPAISGPATLITSGSFSLNTLVSSLASWSIAGGSGVVSTTSGTGNVANVVALSSATSLTITFSITAGQSYPIQFSQVFDVARTCPGSIRYVKAGGTGDGCSWATASGSLQAMLINGNGAQQVWLAGGLYKPTTGLDYTISFVIPTGIQVYGGYAGTGPTPDTRTSFPSSTTLSGDIGTSGNSADNSLHVVRFKNAGSSTRLDGFVITGGSANASGTDRYGAGIVNDGSGPGNSSNPMLANLIVVNNVAKDVGGGLYNDGHNSGNSSPRLTNVSFESNTSTLGGAMYNDGGSGGTASPELINVRFSGNTATSQGGALYTISNGGGTSNPALINVSFSGNTATSGGAVFNDGAGLSLTNSVLFGNGGASAFGTANGGSLCVVRYSLLDSGMPASSFTDDGNNLTTASSPFVSTTNLQLKAGSLAIDAGSSPAYTTASGPTTDLAGNLRIQGSSIDMGAYESTAPADLTPIIYARPTSVYGTSTVGVVIDVVELNGGASIGPISVFLTKDPRLSLTFSGLTTSVNGRAVQNSGWSFDETSNGSFYILTTSQVIAAGDALSVGLRGQLSPGATKGNLSLSAIIDGGSGGEVRITNNSDADRIVYFNK